MITIKNEKLAEEVNKHDQGKTGFAVHAGSSFTTLEKVLNGDSDINLNSIGKLAEFAGMDVIVDFVPQAKSASRNTNAN